MDIAILLFDRVTALDAVGPYEVFSRLPGTTVRFVGREAGPVRTDTGQLSLVADYTLEEFPEPEVLLVPGGPSVPAMMHNEPVLSWIRNADAGSEWTTSVCTGSLLLGAAGLLEGRTATSHWLALDQMSAFGATPTLDRVVVDGKIVTAAGVSSGIDMALALAADMTSPDVAKSIQLGLEYDPEPPFDCGSPTKAAPELVEQLRTRADRC